MSAPPLISVDFSGRRRPLTLAGVLLLMTGALATAAACVEYRRLDASRAGLELKLADANHRNQHDPAQDVRNVCLAHGCRLLSLQSQLVASYAAWRHALPVSNAWFVSIEQGSMAAARLARHGWDRVHVVRIGRDWTRELKRLQTFGRLASHVPEEGKVYVEAPHAWREVAVAAAANADAGGLQWLEDSETALTTLQRLGRARRMAA